MSAEVAHTRLGWARPAALARAAVGVVVGAVLGAAAFLILAAQAEQRGYTSLRFSRALGMLAGEPGRDGADGAVVLVERVSPRGLYAALVLATLLVAVHAVLLEPRTRGRRWPLGGLVLGLVTWLLLVSVYGPLVNSRLPHDEHVAGLFGLDAGNATPVALALASLAFGLVAARAYGLVRSTEWWDAEPHEDRPL